MDGWLDPHFSVIYLWHIRCLLTFTLHDLVCVLNRNVRLEDCAVYHTICALVGRLITLQVSTWPQPRSPWQSSEVVGSWHARCFFIVVVMHPKLCQVARSSIPTLYNSESCPAVWCWVTVGWNLLEPWYKISFMKSSSFILPGIDRPLGGTDEGSRQFLFATPKRQKQR